MKPGLVSRFFMVTLPQVMQSLRCLVGLGAIIAHLSQNHNFSWVPVVSSRWSPAPGDHDPDHQEGDGSPGGRQRLAVHPARNDHHSDRLVPAQENVTRGVTGDLSRHTRPSEPDGVHPFRVVRGAPSSRVDIIGCVLGAISPRPLLRSGAHDPIYFLRRERIRRNSSYPLPPGGGGRDSSNYACPLYFACTCHGGLL